MKIGFLGAGNMAGAILRGIMDMDTGCYDINSVAVKRAQEEMNAIGFDSAEEMCSWADFAKEVFRLAGKDMEVEYVTTAQYLADYPQQAARPANSVLENYMFKMTNGHMFATWEEAIAEYMKTLV